MCLCKDCDTVDITTWGDTPRYQAVLLCLCCGGRRYEHYTVCYYGARRNGKSQGH